MIYKQIKDNLNYIMPFGKYKGRYISEIPDSSNYSPRVDFAVDNCELYDAMDGCLPNQ